jgi:hypothetical protein
MYLNDQLQKEVLEVLCQVVRLVEALILLELVINQRFLAVGV